MFKRSVFILCSFLLLSLCASSQAYVALEKTSFSRYSDGIKTAKLHKFGEHFADDEEHHRLFRKFNRARLTLKLINYSSIGMVAATAIYTYNSTLQRNDSSVPITSLIAVLGLAGTAQVIGLNNAIMIPIVNKRKDKLLSCADTIGSHLETEPCQLSFRIGISSVGLAINF